MNEFMSVDYVVLLSLHLYVCSFSLAVSVRKASALENLGHYELITLSPGWIATGPTEDGVER